MSQFLVLGQIGDPTTGLPGGAGSKLWYLNLESFGQQVTSTGGVDSPLRYDTDDYAILEDSGRTILRRLFLKTAYEGACIIRCTPRIDFDTLLPSQTFQFTQTPTRRTRVLEVKVARVCSYAGLRVEIVSRSARVDFLGLACAHRPLAQAADYVAGTE